MHPKDIAGNRQVALLAEGVDRNQTLLLLLVFGEVALLAEGVDRNCCALGLRFGVAGRPPRGGRG